MKWTIEMRDPVNGLMVQVFVAKTAAEAIKQAKRRHPRAFVSRCVRGVH